MRLLMLVGALLCLAACGGGGGNGGNNGILPPQFLAAARYFPSPLGARYSYRALSVVDPLFNPFGEATATYVVEANPLGAGRYYNLLDQADLRRAPVFDSLSFSGLAEEDTLNFTGSRMTFVTGPGDTADVLPPVLTGAGQQWPISLRLGAPGGTFLSRFNVTGTATLGGLQDVTLGSTTFEDCARVDVSFDYRYLGDLLAGLSGSYFLAPDVGPVLGICRLGGVEIGRVQLVGLEL